MAWYDAGRQSLEDCSGLGCLRSGEATGDGGGCTKATDASRGIFPHGVARAARDTNPSAPRHCRLARIMPTVSWGEGGVSRLPLLASGWRGDGEVDRVDGVVPDTVACEVICFLRGHVTSLATVLMFSMRYPRFARARDDMTGGVTPYLQSTLGRQ